MFECAGDCNAEGFCDGFRVRWSLSHPADVAAQVTGLNTGRFAVLHERQQAGVVVPVERRAASSRDYDRVIDCYAGGVRVTVEQFVRRG